MVDFAALAIEEAQTAAADRSEWNGKLGTTDVTIYAKPLCGADFDYVGKKGYRDFLTNPSMGGMVHLIIRKAETDGGQKCFTPNRDFPVLMKWGQDKVGEIFGELFGDQMDPETEDQFEARVGNSEATKSG